MWICGNLCTISCRAVRADSKAKCRFRNGQFRNLRSINFMGNNMLNLYKQFYMALSVQEAKTDLENRNIMFGCFGT